MSAHRARLGLLAALVLLLGVALLLSRGRAGLPAFGVAGNISYVKGGGANVAVSIGEDGVLLVDAKHLKQAPRLQAAVEELAEDWPAYVIDTHWHPDHTGGNAHFGPRATLVAHANVLKRLEEDPTILGRMNPPMPAAGLPQTTYTDEHSLRFNGEEVRLIHVPEAHTDGDTVVWFVDSGVACVGDLFLDGYPPIDTRSGGDVEGLVRGLRRLLERLPEDVVILPGHSGPTDVATVRAYTDMTDTVTQRVRGHLADGLDIDAMLAAGVVADFDERWGHYENVPARRFLEFVVESLE